MPVPHTLLPDWLDLPRPNTEKDLGRLKQELASKGLNARGWRLYLNYGDLLLDALGKPFVEEGRPRSSQPNALAFLKLLAECEMDVPPPCAMIMTMRDWNIPDARIDTIPVHFFRALWKATMLEDFASVGNAGRMHRFLRESLVPLASWFFATGQHVDPDMNKLKSGWQALARDHEAWKLAETKTREASDPHPAEWPPFVASVEYNGLKFIALASDTALNLEGEEMAHCIGSYGERCRTEMLRAYSVRDRKSGARVATLTVTEVAPGCWNINELKGYENDDVADHVLYAAYGVICAIEDSYATLPAIRRVIDHTRHTLPQQIEAIEEIPF